MSESSEFVAFEQIPAWVALGETERKLVEINDRLEQGGIVPAVRGAFEQAKVKLSSEAAVYAADPELHTAVAGAGHEALTGIEQLRELEGILSSEDLAQVRKGLEAQTDAAVGFFSRYEIENSESLALVERAQTILGVGQVAVKNSELIEFEAATPETQVFMGESQTVPHQRVPETEVSKETVAENVTLTFSKKSVVLGEDGRIIPLSGKNHSKQTDHSEFRKRALLYILNNPDRKIRGKELYDLVCEGMSTHERRNVQQAFRMWVSTLEIDGKNLVLHNGKRASGSEYTANPEFNVDIVDLSTNMESGESKEQSPTALVNPSDFYVAAAHLQRFNFLLEQAGMRTIDDAIVDELSKHQPDWRHLAGDSEKIKQERTLTFQRVQQFINDQEQLLRYIDQTESYTAECALIDIFTDLEGADRQWMSQLLFDADIKSEAVVQVGRGSSNTIFEAKLVAYDRDGREILPPNKRYTEEKTTIRRMDADDYPLWTIEQEEPVDTDIEDITDTIELPVISDVTTDDIAVRGLHETIRGVSPETLEDQIGRRVAEIIEELEAANPQKGARYSLSAVNAVIGGVSKKAVMDANEQGVIPKRRSTDLDLSLEEIVLVKLFSQNQSLVTSNRANRATVKRIVGDQMLAFYERMSR